MLEVIFSIVVGLLIAGYVYISWNYDHWKNKNIPGPKPQFLLGNMPSVLNQKRSSTYDVDDLYKKYKDRHGLIGYFIMRSPALLVLQPDLARDMLIKDFKSFSTNQFTDLIDKDVDPIFSRNPFMLKGEQWKEKRAEITPAFTSSRIKTMYPIVEDVCSHMNKYLENEFDKKPTNGHDAKELAAMFTTDVVSNCIFGVDAGSFAGKDANIRSMSKQLFTPDWKVMVFFMVAQIFPFILKIYKMPFISKNVETFFTKLMKDAITFRRKNNVDRFDYLHYLLELQEKKNLNELDMVGHAITFFIDGFETTSIAVAFILYELARHKNAQDTVRKEIRDTIAKHGKITYDVVSEMPYLDQVLNEALRLYPPVSVLRKVCTERIQVKVKEGETRTIEVGDEMNIPIYCFHRDPEFYDKPDDFYPERFNPENGGIKPFREKGVLVPFGDGPRICLGQRIAQAQVKAAIVSLVINFQIDVNSKTQEPIVLDPKQYMTYAQGGLWLDFKKI